MKKVISIVLILAMVLGLTACGAQSFAGDKLSADFKGSGHKKLTIVFHAEGLETYSREVVVPDGEDGAPIYTANLTKVSGNDVTYKLVGQNEGTANFSIVFTNAAGSTLACNMNINVDSKKHVTFTDLGFSDEPLYTELDEKTQISYAEGFSKLLQLDGTLGPWKIGSYDEEILDVSIEDETEDLQYIFLVTAIAEGDSQVVFINKDAGEKVTFNFSVTSYLDESQASGYSLVLTLIDYEFGEYSREDDPEYQNYRKSTLETLEDIFGDDVYIPDIGTLEDVNYYNESGKSVVDDNGNIIAENCDSIDMGLTIDGAKLDYYVSKSTTFKSQCDDIESLGPVPVTLDLPIKSDTVRYYFTEFGFGVAIWTQGDYVSRLTFMRDQTDEGDRKILYKFLGAEDEYNGQ